MMLILVTLAALAVSEASLRVKCSDYSFQWVPDVLEFLRGLLLMIESGNDVAVKRKTNWVLDDLLGLIFRPLRHVASSA